MSEHQIIKATLTVKLLEDLHSGTGTGGGVLDAIQIRDRRGQPVIRATHAKGLLLDIARELEELCCGETEQDKAKQNKAKQERNALFGQIGAWKRGALMMQSLRAVDHPKMLTWTSTAREMNHRAPLDDTLNIVEYVAAGTEFQATIELRDPSTEDLLKRCIKRLRHLGSRRSRGAGLITVKSEFTKATLLTEPNRQPQSDSSRRLRLVLRNLDPLCLPLTGFPGNIVNSDCYIRGQRLIGAFMGWAIAMNKRPDLAELREGLTMGNALPLPNGVAVDSSTDTSQWDVSPIPLSLQTPKPGGQANWRRPWWAESKSSDDFLGASVRDKLSEENGGDGMRGEKPKRPGDREFLFRPKAGKNWRRYSPHVDIHMRNRAPNKRHSIADELFSVEEIAEDTLFLADLEFHDLAAATAFAKEYAAVLDGQSWLAVGRGGCPVEVANYRWLPAVAKDEEGNHSEDFTLTLQSDLVARTPQLGFYDALDSRMLAELAGCPSLADEKWEVSAVSDTVEVRGFNMTSGLPRVPLLAIRRGSAIRIKGAGCDELRKQLAARAYLGERTWEGFGQFRLDFDPLADRPNETATEGGDDDTGLSSEVGSRESILKKAFELEARLKEQRDRAKSDGKKAPSKSQWQYLREQALIAEKRNAINQVLAELGKHANTQGGTAWNYACLGEIKTAISRYNDLEKARFFIDVLVRRHWIKTLLKEKKQ